MTALNPFARRTLLKAGAAAGVAVTAGPVFARAATAQQADPPAQDSASVFRHGVASGDPLGTAVLLWTRVTPTPDATPGSGVGPAVDVGWELAADPQFATVLKTGTVRTDAERDHTVKVDVTALAPYTRYFFRFVALGATSPVGRTQTAADDGALHALRIGFVSCSNFTGGFFAGYRHLAERDDLDVVVHLGDYIYEYGNVPRDEGGDRFGPDELIGVRDHVPDKEMVSLADYRQRQAQYKSDPDQQAAHASAPWIVIFDDHEVTNDTFDTGAENHQPETEGDFLMRRRRAYQAYIEWMPIRLPDQGVPHRGLRFWRSFSFGPLADLFVIDTRQNRSEQVPGLLGGLFGVDQAINDPDRVIMEPEQLAALKDTLAADDVRWHLIGNQTVFTRVAIPRGLPGREQLGPLGLSSGAFNTDQWDGYGADQLELVQAMADAGADPVVLTGDIHSSWANDVPLDPGTYVPAGPANNSVAVEFVCPSITSDGFSEILGGPTQAKASTTSLQVENPHIRYLDGVGHGFAVLDVTPDRVQTDFFFISDRLDPDATLSFETAFQSVQGSRQISAAEGPVGPRSDSPRTAAGAPPEGAQPTTGPGASPGASGSASPSPGPSGSASPSPSGSSPSGPSPSGSPSAGPSPSGSPSASPTAASPTPGRATPRPAPAGRAPGGSAARTRPTGRSLPDTGGTAAAAAVALIGASAVGLRAVRGGATSDADSHESGVSTSRSNEPRNKEQS